jgi:hypothetical protein
MTLERGRPRDESMNGGSQSTDMSLIVAAPLVSRHRIDLGQHDAQTH